MRKLLLLLLTAHSVGTSANELDKNLLALIPLSNVEIKNIQKTYMGKDVESFFSVYGEPGEVDGALPGYFYYKSGEGSTVKVSVTSNKKIRFIRLSK